MKSVLSVVILLMGGILMSCTPTNDLPPSIEQQVGATEPLVLQRADPFIHRTPAGRYYFIATAPEFDRI